MRYIRLQYERICRMLYWGWAMRDNYDFDSGFMFDMEVLKLKRLLWVFENEGHHWEECEKYAPKMKSIRLAIKIGDKLLEDRYMKHYDLHVAKWGRITHHSEPIPGSPNFKMVPSREMSDKERKEFLEAFETDDRIRARHRRWFYDIIKVHGERWWD